MNRCTLRMLFRSIRASLARYIAIMGIVALGVGFYAGLKCSMPAMYTTADDYLRQTHFHDFRLMSTLGFTEGDVEAFRSLEGVAEAEGGYFTDAYALLKGEEAVYRFMSIWERTDIPTVTSGRMPENAAECLADTRAFSEDDIGRKLLISDKNDADTLGLLQVGTYTIVGLAKTPEYMSTTRDSTALGSGSVKGFVLLPPEAFESEAFHEIRLWCDLPGELYSDAYNSAADSMEPSVRAELSRLGKQRYFTLLSEAADKIAEAEEEIAKGRAELEDGRREAEEKLADAKKELEEGEKKLEKALGAIYNNEQKLEAAMAALPAAKQEIEEKKALIAEKKQEIEAGRRELEEKKQELVEGEEQLAGYRSMIETAKSLLAENESELATLLQGAEAAKYIALAEYYEPVLRLEARCRILQAEIDAAEADPESDVDVAALQADLASAQTELTSARAALAEAEAAYVPDNNGITDTQSVIAEIKGRIAELEAALADAEKQLEDGKAQIAEAEKQLADAEKQIADAEAQIADAEAEIAKAEEEYPANKRSIESARGESAAARKKLDEGWEEYYSAVEEAEKELADGEQKLNEAQEELNQNAAELIDKLKLDVYVLDRGSNAGYVTFESDITIIDRLANIFPLFFALVAAMVSITTMTRMVNEERTVIGTMKALGYGSASIMSKYLLYSGSAALIGCLLGFFLGSAALPYLFWTAYGIIYEYAQIEFYFSPRMEALSLLVAVGGTILVTWLACRQELAGNPAELIRPKAPKKGKRIILEYIKPLWKRLPFLSKVSLRNAFRYPVRVTMLMLGIGGCTALMLAGFGIKDSIANICNYQYDEIFLYDMAVELNMDEHASGEAAAAMWEDQTASYAMIRRETVTARSGAAEKSTTLIASEPGMMEGIVSLFNNSGAIPYPAEGEAVITRKVAEYIPVKPGGRIEVEFDDGTVLSLKVTAICTNYLNHYIYVNSASLEGKGWNCALLKAADGVDSAALGTSLRSKDGVEYVSLTSQERQIMEDSISSLDMVVLMLVVASGALAFITLYNLTNINIMERSREVATVKVLGFYPRETAAYILRENVLLSVLGGLFGLLLGKWLHYVIVKSLVVENLTYDTRISPLSFVLSFVITILFTILTDLFMRTKLEKVNMAESLKSVE